MSARCTKAFAGKAKKKAYNRCRKYAEHPRQPTKPPHTPH